MLLEPWWEARARPVPTEPLRGGERCDVAVVGGGVAGLHAALRLSEGGADVVLLERSFCGGGTSGRSSGFLTPDSELQLSDLIRSFGVKDAIRLWRVPVTGVRMLVSTARRYRIRCELERQDSLFAGIGRHGARQVAAEAEAREQIGEPFIHYDADRLRSVHPGDYSAAVRYGETYTVDPLAYCQGLASALRSRGVWIYELSPVRSVGRALVRTNRGSVRADRIVVAADKLSRRLNPRAYPKYYHALTYLALTEPLDRSLIRALFPRDRLQCWDNRLVYSYYRLTGDDRLLLGGGSALTTFSRRALRTPLVIDRVIARFRRRFPAFRRVEFTRYWPGLIDITQDLLPIADLDPGNRRAGYVIGCAGLPWAAWCGDHLARRVLGSEVEDLTRFLGWNRPAIIPSGISRVVGKPAAFAAGFFAAKHRRARSKS
jgi:gamma-glutamylputrescine oxidase